MELKQSSFLQPRIACKSLCTPPSHNRDRPSDSRVVLPQNGQLKHPRSVQGVSSLIFLHMKTRATELSTVG